MGCWTERTVLRLSSRKQNPEGKHSEIAPGAVVTQTSSNPCLEVQGDHILWHHLISSRISTDNQMGSNSYLASAMESHQSTALLRRRSLFRLRSWGLRLISLTPGGWQRESNTGSSVADRLDSRSQVSLSRWSQVTHPRLTPLLQSKPVLVSVGLHYFYIKTVAQVRQHYILQQSVIHRDIF